MKQKSNHENSLHDLLEDIVPSRLSFSGPDLDQVLALATEQRQRCKRRRTAGTALGVVSIALAMLYGIHVQKHRDPEPPGLAGSPSSPPEFETEISFCQIDDEQLLALTPSPAALMEWPDGWRTLIVLDRYGTAHRFGCDSR